MKNLKKFLVSLTACLLALCVTVFAATTYTIKKGDTVWSIASKNKVSVTSLLRANPQLKNANKVIPGQKVIIPDQRPQSGQTAKPNPTSVSNPTNVSNPPSTAKSFEQQVLTLVNNERAKVGAPPLKLSANASKVAQIKSQDMKDGNYFSHTSPTYGSPFEMLKQFGVAYKSAGENIAKGQKTPESVVNAWMNSEGHRKNILNPNYTSMGVGYTEGNGSSYWTQIFLTE